jgi:pimeloyl-ACP methyl ester carboxylesterase
MNLIRLFWPLLVTCAACAGKTRIADPLARGKVIDSVRCTADTGQSYALYVPDRSERMPVVYLFDSHGKGAYPVSMYKALADTFGFILVCSNNSRNGNDYVESDHIWDALVLDTRNRLPIDTNRIYTCGFSGGAKVAGYLAVMHPEVKGVILNGAAMPDGVNASDYPFAVTLLTGEGDMNMTDLVAFDKDLEQTHTRHRLIVFDGKHEWAPVPVMELAFAGWQFDARLPDTAFIQRYTASSLSRVAAFKKAGRWIDAYRECTLSMAYNLDGVFARMRDTIARTPAYRRQLAALSDQLAREQAAKEVFAEHFEQSAQPYWTKVIDSLQNDHSAMSQRLQAFLSLEFYMYSTRLLGSSENQWARYFIDLYREVDPTNSEGWYLSAVCDVREGRQGQVGPDLRKAFELGFNDVERYRKQPEFQGRPLSDIQR